MNEKPITAQLSGAQHMHVIVDVGKKKKQIYSESQSGQQHDVYGERLSVIPHNCHLCENSKVI